MKFVDFKPFLILVTCCVVVGFLIEYFTGFNSLTAAMVVMIAVLINGLAIFAEDIELGGFDYREGVTDTSEAKKEQRKLMKIQGFVIIFLVICVLFSVA